MTVEVGLRFWCCRLVFATDLHILLRSPPPIPMHIHTHAHAHTYTIGLSFTIRTIRTKRIAGHMSHKLDCPMLFTYTYVHSHMFVVCWCNFRSARVEIARSFECSSDCQNICYRHQNSVYTKSTQTHVSVTALTWMPMEATTARSSMHTVCMMLMIRMGATDLYAEW